MRRVSDGPFTLDDVVRDPRRVESFLPVLPPSHKVKGAFLAPLAKRLGVDFERVRATLVDPPRDGFLPFRDYPAADHDRLLGALVDREHPDVPQSEGLRRWARADMTTLVDTRLGRVVLSLVGGPVDALLRVPSVYVRIAPGFEVEAEREAGGVALTFRHLYGVWAYQVGQLEGIVQHFHRRTRIDVFEDPDAFAARLHVEIID